MCIDPESVGAGDEDRSRRGDKEGSVYAEYFLAHHSTWSAASLVQNNRFELAKWMYCSEVFQIRFSVLSVMNHIFAINIYCPVS